MFSTLAERRHRVGKSAAWQSAQKITIHRKILIRSICIDPNKFMASVPAEI